MFPFSSPERTVKQICIVVLACAGSAGASDLTADHLEYGTRSKDERFLQDFASEAARDFNAPFDLLAKGQAALQKEAGILLYFDYYGVFLGNPTGGLDQSVGYSHEIVIGGHFDLDKMIGWKGAVLTASFADGTGHNLSQNIGNYFTVSESYVENTGVLFDLYLTQKLFDDKLDLRIGRMSTGQFFATLPAFGLQVNGGINGNPNNLFSNAPFHAGITATNAAMIKYKPTKESYVSTGIFQATPRLGVYAYHGADFSIRQSDGILMMFEGGWKPTFGASKGLSKDKEVVANPGLPGIYKVGGYWSNYTFDQFSGGQIANAYGFYAMGQQMVWRSSKEANDNFSLWGGVVYSPQTNISSNPFMGMAGTIWQGLIPGRDQDQWLTCFLISNYSRSYANSPSNPGTTTPTYEAVLETSYVIQLNKYISIQPDIQYVIRPNGYGNIPNALVIGLQSVISF
ncbi:MAG: carbohydrate porin [Verrucomicrobiae bacterium]